MMPQTNAKLIYMVVGTAAGLSIMFMTTMCLLMFTPFFIPVRSVLDDKVFAALVQAGTATLSFLFGVLVNTRTSSPAQAVTETTITKTQTNAEPVKPAEPAEVIVANPPDNPVKTEAV